MFKFITLFTFLFFCSNVFARVIETGSIRIIVINSDRDSLFQATVTLFKAVDSSIVKVETTGKKGVAFFDNLAPGIYFAKASFASYAENTTSDLRVTNGQSLNETITLAASNKLLGEVTVVSKKPLLQFLPDKTIINVDAGITNAGASAMDVLEKSPGITIGRDGTISMKGKPQVMVLIDGKQTQLNGADLQSYLSGISASQLDVIELIENPSAKYDAAGNAGIINIKTKKNKQRGFNGSLSISLGHGKYAKNNNSFNANYREGKFNLFANYGARFGTESMSLYALRKYFNQNGVDSLLLQQPNFVRTKIKAHNIRTGVDFFASDKTTLGMALIGSFNDRRGISISTIDWMSPSYNIDSTINTFGTRDMNFERKGINFNAKHSFNSNSEISGDVDYIQFSIDGSQNFETQLQYSSDPPQLTKGNVPSALEIFTAKFDYSKRFKELVWESGMKTAATNTNNLAQYYYCNSGWHEDLSRSNHFLYDENIHSVYSSIDAQKEKWHWQMGLRYEYTTYNAKQLGNAMVKDSAFNKKYRSLFPTVFVSVNADSSNTFGFRMGRRIDRPQFQNLNPFIVTINKYTFEGGNPYIRPQYTWNFEITHTYKQILSTTVSYSFLKDYFSQIFVIDSNRSNVNKNTIIYTRGNVGSFKNIGLSTTLQLPVKEWWNLTASAVYNYKIIEGFVWAPMKATISQVNFSITNQFQFNKGWSAELSGRYLSNSQTDLQEVLTPQAEMWAGVSKQVFKSKGTVRFTLRDITYSQNYSGYSKFQNSDEPFRIKWDSRIALLSFNWRFGKTMKSIKRTGGGATEETERVGNGN